MKEKNAEKIFIRNKPKYNDLVDGIDLKELADRVMNLPGRAKGETIASNLNGIKGEKGENGLNSVEKMMGELGYEISFKNIKSNDYYLESLNLLINIVYKKIFNADDDEIFLLGRNSAKLSFFAKIMMRHFVSLEAIERNAPRYWKMNMDFAELQIANIDKDKKELFTQVIGYNKSSISCIFQGGYFYETLRFVLGESLFIEEVRCVHDGDSFHEYKITWE